MNLHLDIHIVFKKLLSSNHELEDSRPSPLKSLKSQSMEPILTQAFQKST
jgi:hypothetical protein